MTGAPGSVDRLYAGWAFDREQTGRMQAEARVEAEREIAKRLQRRVEYLLRLAIQLGATPEQLRG